MEVLGLLIIMVGILSLFPPLIKILLTMGNILRGSKTHITQGTIVLAQIGAIVTIIVGIFIIFSSSSKNNSRLDLGPSINSIPRNLPIE